MNSDRIKKAWHFKANLKSIFFRPNDNYAAIDGLRGLSFVWMFMFHCFLYAKYHYGYDKLLSLIADSPVALDWLWNADKAVDTFFFLSGFLIGGLLFREHQKTGDIKLMNFYGRRYLRLTPVYVVAILIYWAMRGPHYQNLWQNLLYINNFFPYETMAMVWTWTLAVEEQFYLIFPLTVLLLMNKSIFYRGDRRINLGLGLLFLFALSFAIRALLVYGDPRIRGIDMSVLVSDYEHLHHYSSAMYDNLYTRYGAFICGIFIAYLHAYYKQAVSDFLTRRVLIFALNLLFLGTFITIIWLPVSDPSVNFSQGFKDFYIIANRNLFCLCLAWIILLSINKDASIKWLNAFLSFKAWYPLAQLSYSMYIFHVVFISLLMFRVRWLTDYQYLAVDDITPAFMLLFCAVTLLITFIFSIITYVLVEKPFMNLRAPRTV